MGAGVVTVWEGSGQRPKEVWRELCGSAESRTGQRWVRFEGQQKAVHLGGRMEAHVVRGGVQSERRGPIA